jgi:hypothetical protein
MAPSGPQPPPSHWLLPMGLARRTLGRLNWLFSLPGIPLRSQLFTSSHLCPKVTFSVNPSWPPVVPYHLILFHCSCQCLTPISYQLCPLGCQLLDTGSLASFLQSRGSKDSSAQENDYVSGIAQHQICFHLGKLRQSVADS